MTIVTEITRDGGDGALRVSVCRELEQHDPLAKRKIAFDFLIIPGVEISVDPLGEEHATCDHLLCALQRVLAGLTCQNCGKRIGYNTPFERVADIDSGSGVAHVPSLACSQAREQLDDHLRGKYLDGDDT